MAMRRWWQGILLGMVSVSLAMAMPMPAGADVLQFDGEVADPPTWEMKLAFQNLAFGESRESVRSKLAAFKFLSEANSGESLVFGGTVIGREAKVWTAFTPMSRRLWKVVVYFTPPDGEAVDCYRKVLTILRSKYRAPRTSFEVFQDPFDDRAGHAEQAIRAGKGQFVTTWGLSDGDIACRIERDLRVAISYESRRLSLREDDEQQRAMKDEI